MIESNGGKEADITRLHSEMLVMQADYELQIAILRGEIGRLMSELELQDAISHFLPTSTSRSIIHEFKTKDLRIAELEKELREANRNGESGNKL